MTSQAAVLNLTATAALASPTAPPESTIELDQREPASAIVPGAATPTLPRALRLPALTEVCEIRPMAYSAAELVLGFTMPAVALPTLIGPTAVIDTSSPA